MPCLFPKRAQARQPSPFNNGPRIHRFPPLILGSSTPVRRFPTANRDLSEVRDRRLFSFFLYLENIKGSSSRALTRKRFPFRGLRRWRRGSFPEGLPIYRQTCRRGISLSARRAGGGASPPRAFPPPLHDRGGIILVETGFSKEKCFLPRVPP